jgi:hypothetical protein
MALPTLRIIRRVVPVNMLRRNRRPEFRNPDSIAPELEFRIPVPGIAAGIGSQAKNIRVESAGNSVFNREPGNRALPSPIRLGLTLLLQVDSGQYEIASSILAGLPVNGTPTKNITATGTAKDLHNARNTIEFSSCLNKGNSPSNLTVVMILASTEFTAAWLINHLTHYRDKYGIPCSAPRTVADHQKALLDTLILIWKQRTGGK